MATGRRYRFQLLRRAKRGACPDGRRLRKKTPNGQPISDREVERDRTRERERERDWANMQPIKEYSNQQGNRKPRDKLTKKTNKNERVTHSLTHSHQRTPSSSSPEPRPTNKHAAKTINIKSYFTREIDEMRPEDDLRPLQRNQTRISTQLVKTRERGKKKKNRNRNKNKHVHYSICCPSFDNYTRA